MTSLVDTVARALRMDAMCSHDDMWDTLTQISRDVWRRAAVTALKAIRIPTEPMVTAGALAGEMYGNTDARATWTAMCDVALAEHEAIKMAQDFHAYGTAVMRDGKHIPATEVYLPPQDDTELNNPIQKAAQIWR